MYYITVSNGLLSPEHKKKMGSAVWEFMWCLDKMTRIDDKGRGVVLGGKPIKLEEIGMGHDNTTSRNMHKLEDEGYITTTRTPFGMVIYINKPKKKFNKSEKSPTNNGDSLKPVIHQKWESPTGNGESPTNNGGYKEDNTVDSTDDKTEALPEWLNLNAWEEWKQYKKERKQKLTPSTVRHQLKVLEADQEHQVEIINYSIANGYTGLFALKTKPNSKKIYAG